MNLIAAGVAFEFRHPECAVVGRRRGVPATPVAMPEAAMHEDNGLIFRQHNVGFAGKVLPVKTKPKTKFVEKRANALLRGRVLAPNSAHVPGTTFFVQPVTHGPA